MYYVFTLDGVKYVAKVDKNDYEIIYQDREYQDPHNSLICLTAKRKFYLIPTFSVLREKLNRWGKRGKYKIGKYPKKPWHVVLPKRLKTKEDLFIETL